MVKPKLKYLLNLTKITIISFLSVVFILIYRLLINLPITFFFENFWSFNAVNFSYIFSVCDIIIIFITLFFYNKYSKIILFMNTGFVLLHIPVFFDLFNVLSYLFAPIDKCNFVYSYVNFGTTGLIFLRFAIFSCVFLLIYNKFIKKLKREYLFSFYFFYVILILYTVYQ
jgi:hypothetical protein